MSHTIVKITKDNDGEIVRNPKWHLVESFRTGENAALCTGEYFGYGQSNCKFVTRTVKSGSITCGRCLEIIGYIKEINLK